MRLESSFFYIKTAVSPTVTQISMDILQPCAVRKTKPYRFFRRAAEKTGAGGVQVKRRRIDTGHDTFYGVNPVGLADKHYGKMKIVIISLYRQILVDV